MADTEARWYCLNALGQATLCRDEADALDCAKESDATWPRNAPSRAVLLGPVAELLAERDRLRAMVAHLAVPVGYVLAPVRATPEIRQAMRTGSRKDWPSDELCDVRWAAVVAAIRSGNPLQALADNARELGLTYEDGSKT